MIKWLKLTSTYFLGFFPLGIVFFLLQELPYLILPRLGVSLTPLMSLPTAFSWLDFLEKFFGIATVVTFVFIVRTPIRPQQLFLRAAAVPLAIYYVGWGIYTLGFHALFFYLFFLVLMPPLYYIFLGLWRKNKVSVLLGLPFLILHLINFSINFLK